MDSNPGSRGGSVAGQESEQYPALMNLNRGYFHQDYEVLSEDPDEVVAAFRAENPPAQAAAVVVDILRFLATYGHDERGLTTAFKRVFTPEVNFLQMKGRETSEGLAKIVEILSEAASSQGGETDSSDASADGEVGPGVTMTLSLKELLAWTNGQPPRGKEGGYTIARHIDVDDAELRARALRNPRRDAVASRFFSKKVAEDAINEALRANRPAVKCWYEDPQARTTYGFAYDYRRPLGVGFVKASGAMQEMSALRLLFIRAKGSEKKFYLLTAYPVISESAMEFFTRTKRKSGVREYPERAAYPALANLVEGYFHQDYETISDDPDVLLAVFRAEEAPGNVRLLADEIRRFVEVHGASDEGLAEAFDRTFAPEFGFDGSDGRSVRESLLRMAEILAG